MDWTIEELTVDHPDWQQLVQVMDEVGQKSAAFNAHFMPFSRHFVVARQAGDIVGYLMFVVWEIGPHDRNQQPVQHSGDSLTEAKIIAFGVREACRRQGIGRALQERTLQLARDLGCYQVRSVSNYERGANHQLKLSMGFGVEPMEREKPSLAFVMPLRAGRLLETGD